MNNKTFFVFIFIFFLIINSNELLADSKNENTILLNGENYIVRVDFDTYPIKLGEQFIDINNSMLLQYFILVGTFILPELFWLLLYAYLGDKSSHWFLAHGRAKFFNRITGGVFMGAGVLLSTTNRN